MDLFSKTLTPPLPQDPLEWLSNRQVFLGTSSWKYPGWKGWFYQESYPSDRAFETKSLEEYARYLPCVGVDHTYYAWPGEKTLQTYDKQTPSHFRFGFKVTDRITVYRFPRLPRYGKHAGQTNPDFLNADRFKECFLAPLKILAKKTGPVIFEFSRFNVGTIASGREFLERLSAFLKELQGLDEFCFCVELRNANWLRPEYFALLESMGVGHVLSSWTSMPPLGEQLSLCRGRKMPAFVSRVLLEPGTHYANAVEAFAPYDKIQNAQSALRDSICRLITEALENNRPAYVFVNNRAEGCAPRTLSAVIEQLQAQGTVP